MHLAHHDHHETHALMTTPALAYPVTIDHHDDPLTVTVSCVTLICVLASLFVCLLYTYYRRSRPSGTYKTHEGDTTIYLTNDHSQVRYMIDDARSCVLTCILLG